MALNPSRRDLISGRFSRESGHIASIMVQARPEFLTELTSSLNGFPGVEVHGSNGQGRMVVTVEADNDGHLMETITRIEATKHVMSALLVYHQIED